MISNSSLDETSSSGVPIRSLLINSTTFFTSLGDTSPSTLSSLCSTCPLSVITIAITLLSLKGTASTSFNLLSLDDDPNTTDVQLVISDIISILLVITSDNTNCLLSKMV